MKIRSNNKDLHSDPKDVDKLLEHNIIILGLVRIFDL